MKLISLLLGLFITFNISAQTIIISGEEGNRKLRWTDFTGTPDDNSPFIAHTWYNIRTKPVRARLVGGAFVVDTVAVVLELDPNRSWAKKDRVTDELLVHEQGHFDIGILCMREIVETLSKTTFTASDLRTKLQSVISGTIAKYNDLSAKYDDETSHANNKRVQLKWNDVLAARLAGGADR